MDAPDRRRRAPVWISAPAIACAALLSLPLVYLFIRAAGVGEARLLALVLTEETLRLTLRTLALVMGVLGVSWLIAIPMAWLVVRTDLPGRRLWAVMGALPLAFPSYVAAFSWVTVLGPKGYLQGWLAPFGVDALPNWAYGYVGALLVLSLFTYPYLYLVLVAALVQLDPAYEESSLSLGMGPWLTFWRVTLPQLRPALAAGSLLVALYAVSDFGAVSIVGFNTFTLAIYNAYRALFDRSLAAALSLVLVLLTLGLIGWEAWSARRSRPTRLRAHRLGKPVLLAGWRWPALMGLGSVLLLNLGVPVGVISYWGVRALQVGNTLSSAWAAAGHSITVAAIAAVVAVALSLPVSLWGTRYPSFVAATVEKFTLSGYALPGLVVALALVFLATRHVPALYQTLPLLILAYVVRFFPQALAATRSSLRNLSPRFEEAGRSLGRGPIYVLGTLTAPLVRPGLLAGGGLVFLTAMKELPATLILRPTGYETLATRVWSAAAEGIYSQAAVPALVLVSISVLPIYYLVIRPALTAVGR